jgi:hypothetical protein
MAKNITNGHKVATNIPNAHEIFQVDKIINQHFPFQGFTKYTQIEIIGKKIYHLATLDIYFRSVFTNNEIVLRSVL